MNGANYKRYFNVKGDRVSWWDLRSASRVVALWCVNDVGGSIHEFWDQRDMLLGTLLVSEGIGCQKIMQHLGAIPHRVDIDHCALVGHCLHHVLNNPFCFIQRLWLLHKQSKTRLKFLVERARKFCEILYVTNHCLNYFRWFILNFSCLNFVCCCDIFQVASKNFIRLGSIL